MDGIVALHADLDDARKRVAEGEARVERRRELIATQQSSGFDTRQAERILGVLEMILARYKEELRELLDGPGMQILPQSQARPESREFSESRDLPESQDILGSRSAAAISMARRSARSELHLSGPA